MDETYGKSDETSLESERIFWRRAELSDLSELNEMITEQSHKTFVFSDVARLITDNPLSLCRVDSNGEILLFASLSDRPVVDCVAHERWTEWFNYFYDLPDVDEHNTAFVHLILFRCVESLIHVRSMLDTVYFEMPDINYIVLVKLPGAKLCPEMSVPFSVLPAKNVTADPDFGRPEIMYRARATSVQRIRLRAAKLDDSDDLRAALGNRLDFLDRFYGDGCLADILRSPGEGRVNLVPTIEANGLVTANTNVNYPLLDTVFDLCRYAGLVELKDNYETVHENIILRPPDVSEMKEQMKTTDGSIDEHFNIDENELMSFSYEGLNGEIENLSSQSDPNSSQSILELSRSTNSVISSNEERSYLKKLCDTKVSNIVKNFFKYQEKPLKNKSVTEMSLNIIDEKSNYQKTAFMIELMLIDHDEEKKASWDYFVACFHCFPNYTYCLMTLQTIVTPPLFKKFFCKVPLKPKRHCYMGQLYLLHRSFLFGKFTCVMVTEENYLDIMERLIVKNHHYKSVISDNISKSVFEDTRYKTLNDEMERLSGDFDVARYLFAELANKHAVDLLNMEIQEAFVKKTRRLLSYVMADSDANCLFYRLYPDSTAMKRHGMSYVTCARELIPVRPRVRIQSDDDDDDDGGGVNVSCDCEKFALFHMNTRLCTIQKTSVDAKIVVIGASAVALSFIENLVFNPANHRISFDNVVLISDHGLPYQVDLNDLENIMVPKTEHFDHEYMKSIALQQAVDIITGTVTGINRVDKYVIVNESDLVYYDYLFLFYGEQFKFSIDCNKVKSDKKKMNDASNNVFSVKSSNENEALENVLLLNSEKDISYAFNYIKTMKESDRDVVVYGKYLGSLSVINVLLESNIDGSRIVYAESDIKENLPYITSRPILFKVYEELRKHGVRVCEQCDLKELKLNEDRTKVLRVTFSSDAGLLTVNCAGLFWFVQKSINDVNRHMMVQSSFKFDGRVLVNASFETNAEFAYAAGPAAEFARCADSSAESSIDSSVDYSAAAASSHARYSSAEIGARAADALVDRLGVTTMVVVGRRRRRVDAAYVRPLSVRCRLPGGYDYLHAAAPGRPTRPASAELRAETLGTDDAVNGCFEMVVDRRGDVLELSCCSKRNIEYLNLTNLCGKNVNLFNDMIDRLRTNSIPCFFDYFRESWARPLYSDRFWRLLDDTIMDRVKNNDKAIKKFLSDNVDVLMSEFNASSVAELSARVGLDGRFDEVFGEELRKILIDFVDENVNDFPAFSHVRDAVDRNNSYD